MSMNIVQLQKALKNVPDQTLVKYVQNPTPEVPQYLALSELQSRKQLRQRMQGQQAIQQQGQQAQQPSVAQQEMAGVAELPVGDMYEGEEYARGGIVSFAGGGDIDDEIRTAIYGRDINSTPFDPMYAVAAGKDALAYPFGYRTVIDPATGKPTTARKLRGGADASIRAEQKRQAQIRQAWNDKINKLYEKKEGIVANTAKAKEIKADERSGAAYLPSQQPTDGEDIYGNINPKPDFLSQQEAKQGILSVVPPSDLAGGVSGGASVTRSAGGRGPAVGAQQVSWTDLADRSGEYDKLMRNPVTAQEEMARRQALLGEDTGRQELKDRLAKMEEQAAKEGKAAPWMALARAGLGMAAGNSQFALQNIATGGIEGLTDYQQALQRQRDAEEKRFGLRSQVARDERAEQVQGADFGLNSEERVRAGNEANRMQKLGYETSRDTANAQGRFDASKTNAQLSMDARKLAETIRANMAQEGLTKSQINKEWDTVSRIAQQIKQDNPDITDSEAITRAYETKNPGFGATEQRALSSQEKNLVAQLAKESKFTTEGKAARARIEAELAALRAKMNGVDYAAPVGQSIMRFDSKGNPIQ